METKIDELESQALTVSETQLNSNLEFKNLVKNYGNTQALKGINISLPKGSIVGLLGPNGSGKTTMLKLAAGLLQPTAGEIYVCGLKPGAESKALVSYQADKVFVNDTWKIKDYFGLMKDFYTNFDQAKAMDMLGRLKLEPNKKLKELSKGNKEKVQLISTMSRQVPLYLLDEPIGGVDPAARDYILNTIISNYSENATVVISTHLINDVESVLNHIVFVKEGEIVRQGNADEIRENTGMSIDALFREEFKC